MSVTINDLILTGVVYQDVYASSGIVIGTPLVIQNKSASAVWLQIASSLPSNSSREGFVIFPGNSVSVENAAEGLYAFGTGRLHVAQDIV